ncbi:MAG TPA: Rieske 2Fe-2S domain-containing protein [Kofleriaceae bacterium]|nr:Rieske 2Fe-2S domain-containing protein [Kofleriaceae bacterium]
MATHQAPLLPGDPVAWTRLAHAPAAGTVLGTLDDIPDGQGREYVFGPAHDAFRMFIVRRGYQVFGYLNICPHFSLRLNYRANQFTTRDGEILCSMHFALFRMDDGVCIEGACPGRALDPVPVEALPDGTLRIAGAPPAR